MIRRSKWKEVVWFLLILQQLSKKEKRKITNHQKQSLIINNLTIILANPLSIWIHSLHGCYPLNPLVTFSPFLHYYYYIQVECVYFTARKTTKKKRTLNKNQFFFSNWNHTTTTTFSISEPSTILYHLLWSAYLINSNNS